MTFSFYRFFWFDLIARCLMSKREMENSIWYNILLILVTNLYRHIRYLSWKNWLYSTKSQERDHSHHCFQCKREISGRPMTLLFSRKRFRHDCTWTNQRGGTFSGYRLHGNFRCWKGVSLEWRRIPGRTIRWVQLESGSVPHRAIRISRKGFSARVLTLCATSRRHTSLLP